MTSCTFVCNDIFTKLFKWSRIKLIKESNYWNETDKFPKNKHDQLEGYGLDRFECNNPFEIVWSFPFNAIELKLLEYEPIENRFNSWKGKFKGIWSSTYIEIVLLVKMATIKLRY